MYSRAEKRFLRINLIAIVSLFLLILAGGVVRSSGSGMGCPDWPKCFDQYIPPTDISQLPVDYQKKYVAQRQKKNEKFAQLLEKTGYADLALKIRLDKSINIPEEFNPIKTYTEYINRLIGALTGFLLLLTAVFAVNMRKSKPLIFWLSLFNLFLVGFQAWLGSIVVSTNLVAWMITVHMLVAILILAVSIYTYDCVKSSHQESLLKSDKSLILNVVTVLALLISIVQITMGTEVRESIDAVKNEFPELSRGEWLNEVGRVFSYHRDLALLILIVNGVLFYLLRKVKENSAIMQIGNSILAIIGLQIITGIALSYFALAPWAQATHVLLATLLFGAQFYLLLMFKRKPLTVN